MSDIPAGWYDDGHGALRWYDGADWTEHVASAAPQPAPPSGRRGMPLWGWVLVGAGALVVMLGVVGAGVGVFIAQRAPIVAAKSAIEKYDAAWVNADCGALTEATTDALREDWGYDDCSAFVADAKDFDEANRDYHTVINSSDYARGEVAVTTTESYTDEDGKQLVDQVTYTVVKDGDVWRIDAIDFADGSDGSGGDQYDDA